MKRIIVIFIFWFGFKFIISHCEILQLYNVDDIEGKMAGLVMHHDF